MQSSCFVTKQICTLSIDPNDEILETFGADILCIVQKKKISHVIVNMDRFEIVTSQTIEFIEKLVNILKLNSVKTVVCGFSVQSASILFHFVENVTFDITLDVQSALDVINHQ